MKSYYIQLIRNGLTEGNVSGKYVGHIDEPLSREGIAQIEQMKSDYKYPPVDAVFASPLSRCTQTAKIIYPNCEPIVINGLIEYNFGEFEQCTADDLKDNEDFKNWIGGDIYAKTPYGESNAEFAQRICAAFEKVIDGCIKT